MTEVITTLIMQGGLEPDYVLDKMEQYEIEPFFQHIQKKNKESWEQTRFLGYIIAQTQSTKKLKIKDIITFPWDEEQHETTVSSEEIQRLREKAKQMERKVKIN